MFRLLLHSDSDGAKLMFNLVFESDSLKENLILIPTVQPGNEQQRVRTNTSASSQQPRIQANFQSSTSVRQNQSTS